MKTQSRIKEKQISKLASMFDFFKSNSGPSEENLPLFTSGSCQKVDHQKSSYFGTRNSGTKNFLKAFLAIALLMATGCTYKSPATDVPMLTDNSSAKSFFVTTKIDPKTGLEINVPKTFLCGWASEMETGWTAQSAYMNNALVPEHCNLVFEITESKLVGKLINPSFPTDPKRWEIVITIPIASHYYIETEKDANGKDTKRVIKNSSRSHWSARPYMDLNLENINFEHKWNSSYFGGGVGNINIEKVVWDTKTGFLGFTINRGTGASHYSRIRFNIKEFTHNPNFKETPFNDQNYKRMNVLHIIGEKVNGIYPILKAAHWDTTKTHELRLWQFPEEYKEVMHEIVKDWNEAFRSIGAVEAGQDLFKISDEPAEFAFDLRYSTIAWVADDKISTYSPLGVGMAIADVKNGEIGWGMITIYGGYIEKYVKAYSPNAGGNSVMGKIASQFLSKKSIPHILDLPPELKQLSFASRLNMTQAQSELAAQKVSASFMAQTNKPLDRKALTLEATAAAKASATVLPEHIQKMFADMITTSQTKASQSGAQTNNQNYSETIKQALFPSVSQSELDTENKTAKTKEQLFLKYAGPQFCSGRTFADVGAGWAQAASEMPASLFDDKKVLRHVIKELITHEYGHFLGLGHQFKENILPLKGSVPDSIYDKLAFDAKNGFTNYSSVMGYRSPRAEIADYKKNILPGPQDLLVLRFLYNKEYATYKTGDLDFTFEQVPKNGIIPDAPTGKEGYKTSYFPQCNDLEASYSFDPFCNRFDRGYDAKTIVTNYFSDLKDTMIQNQFAFTDAKGGCPECVEGSLWNSSLRTMGRVRLFYDYMRLYYKKEIDQIRGNEEALLEFSNACVSGQTDNVALNKIFTEKPQLKELCQANAIALDEYKNLVSKNGPDFTKKDVSERFSPGGMAGGDAERDWSRITGSWTEMTMQPLKISALYALTTGVPWLADFGMWSVPLFDDPNYKFAYSSLYPKEYTQIIAANVKNNMRFASLGQNETTSMGNSIVSMGWFNHMSNTGNNDAALFPPQYIERIRTQGKFEFSAVAVILKGRKKEGTTNFVDRFEGEVYDFNTSKSTPLTNAYLLPNGLVVVNTPNMFLYPFTRFSPYSDTDGYVLAYKLDYTRETSDPLAKYSVKIDLKELNDRLIDACVLGTNGVNNGLSKFFTTSEPKFEGFKMTTGLARGERKEFLDSVDKAFNTYYNEMNYDAKPKPETCLETVRGLGLIISSAAVINGFWLPEVMDYIQK